MANNAQAVDTSLIKDFELTENDFKTIYLSLRVFRGGCAEKIHRSEDQADVETAKMWGERADTLIQKLDAFAKPPQEESRIVTL